jgi:hypothetical protein
MGKDLQRRKEIGSVYSASIGMHVPARLSTHLTNADLLRLVSRGGAVDNSYPALRLLPHDTNAYVSQ